VGELIFVKDGSSAVGLADVDEAPETGAAPDLPDGGCGRGRLLTSVDLAGQVLLVRFADAVLDDGSGENGFEGVHVGLLVWDRVGFDLMSRSCVDAEESSVRLPTL
jgi:hypothetical protein